MKRLLAIFGLLLFAAAGLIVFLFGPSDEDSNDGFDPHSPSGELSGPVDAGSAALPSNGNVPLPDPNLAREKLWEEKRDLGPPPDGFGTHFVQTEERFQKMFRRAFTDEIELCLDDVRRKGEVLDGRLAFKLLASPRPDFRVNFTVTSVEYRDRTDGSNVPALGSLPDDVRRCVKDSVESTDVRLSLFTAPLFAVTKQPRLYVDYEVLEESPLGPVEIVEPPPQLEEPQEEPAAPAEVVSDAGSPPAIDAGTPTAEP